MPSEDTSAKKSLEAIHLQIHALRLIADYKASVFEAKVNGIISEHYKETCDECKQRTTRKVEEGKKKGNFMDKLLGGD